MEDDQTREGKHDVDSGTAHTKRDAQSDETIQLPAEKAFFLQRLEVVREIQDELLAWGRRRFWVVSLVFIGVGFIGGASLLTTLVENRVNSRMTAEIGRYQVKLDELREAVAVARSATGDASKAADSVEIKLLEFEKEAKELATRASALRADLSNASSKGLAVSEDLRAELARLAKVVDLLAMQSDASEATMLAAQVEQIETSLDRAKSEIQGATATAGWTQYPVQIINFTRAQVLVNQLTARGYSTYILYGDGSFGSFETMAYHGTILVGVDVPVEVVAPVIRIAKEILPFLKYVELAEYRPRSSEIVIGFVGPAPNTGYRPLKTEDFRRLSDVDQSLEDLHSLIRSFKPEA